MLPKNGRISSETRFAKDITLTSREDGWDLFCPGCGGNHFLPKTTYILDASQTLKPKYRTEVGPAQPGHPQAGRVDICGFSLTKGVLSYDLDCTHDLSGMSFRINS